MWFALPNRPFCPGLMMPLKKPFTCPLAPFRAFKLKLISLFNPLPTPTQAPSSNLIIWKCCHWAVGWFALFFFYCHVH